MKLPADPQNEIAAEIAEAGIRAMARVVWGQTVSQDLMIDAALRVLWAWCAPSSELISRSGSAAPSGNAYPRRHRGAGRKLD
jgi:hypothetical protein